MPPRPSDEHILHAKQRPIALHKLPPDVLVPEGVWLLPYYQVVLPDPTVKGHRWVRLVIMPGCVADQC